MKTGMIAMKGRKELIPSGYIGEYGKKYELLRRHRLSEKWLLSFNNLAHWPSTIWFQQLYGKGVTANV